MKKPDLYAIVPVLSSQIGHCFQYHLSVQKALHSMKWDYTPLVPKDAQIPPATPQWRAILAHAESREGKSVYFRIKTLIANFFIFRRFLASLSKQSESIIFVECFDVEHFASLFLAICFNRRPIQLWILHRYVFEKLRMKTLIYRAFHWSFEKLIGKENARYLSDSETLADEQQRIYDRNFFVVPIPHTHDSFQVSKMQNKEVLLWWPGGSIRDEKGFSHVQRISLMLQDKPMRLVIAEKAKSLISDHSHIRFIPTEISRDDYVKWMHQVDLIILPYSSIQYAYRSSGVFVEAITMGAMPVVTQGTWMAHELKKYDLDALAIDWNRPDLLDYLAGLPSNREIAERLTIMKTAYRDYHSEKKFGEVFLQIWSGSRC